MRIGLTGASGNLGRAALGYLLDRVSASDVVAITRQPAKLDEFSAQGVTVRQGNFGDPSGLPGAFDGIDRLLIIPLPDLMPGVRPPQHLAAIDAAAASGVGHIIYVSTIGARPGARDGILETHFVTEQALIGSPVSWTLLRMGPYTDFLLDAAKQALASGTYSAVPGAPAAYVVRDDLALAAATILGTSGHEGITYHGTGPVSVTQAQIAESLTAIRGGVVQFAPLTAEQHEAGLAAAGLPAPMVDVLERFNRASQDGAFDLVSGDIERLTGTRPESPAEFLGRALDAAAAR